MIISIQNVAPPVPDPTVGPELAPAVSMPELRRVSLATTIYLTGSDGSVWDLTNGPVWLQPGAVGFTPPNLEHRWSTSPMLAGQNRVGYGVGEQRLVLPVFVDAPSSLEWRDLDVALWQALGPDKECQVTVVSPDGQARVMSAWFTGVGDDAASPIDPIAAGWSQYQLEFDAEDPYWQGASSVQTFTPAAPVDYYAPPGSAYVKALMPTNSLASSTLANPGDAPGWPLVSVTGSVANFTVTIDGGSVSYGAVADGQTVWIDYHPARQTVGFSRGSNSESAWLGVTSRDFKRVLPGAEVPISITLTTPGVNASLSVELTPRYRRPW